MKTVWEKQDAQGMKDIMAFGEDYRQFLSRAKTEREFVHEAKELMEEAGFQNLKLINHPLKAGDRVYTSNRGKNICLFVIGEEPLTEGMNVLGAHIDSPRLDLKQHPLYESDGLALFDTHYYGGIKKYQWTTRPMALHGIICRKDGSRQLISIGEKADEPVVGISEILVHLAAQQMEKPGKTVVEGEALDVLAASIPEKGVEKDPVKTALLKLLKKQYDIEEDDFISAELEVVPAGEARDFGLDRSMIMGYGHDDRVCAYTSLRAILEMKKPRRTSCCILVDKEEIGSVGATGMHSRFFEYSIAKLLALQGKTALTDLNDTFTNSCMLSSDVSAGLDPLYESVFEKKNTAVLGNGIVFNKYTGSRGKSGSNDTDPEFIAQVRRVMDEDGVQFQTAELGAVDAGGGGTIAYILANLNMDVMDAGIAVLSMHSPAEIVSKADVYEGYRAYKTFLNKIQG